MVGNCKSLETEKIVCVKLKRSEEYLYKNNWKQLSSLNGSFKTMGIFYVEISMRHALSIETHECCSSIPFPSTRTVGNSFCIIFFDRPTLRPTIGETRSFLSVT